VLPSRGGEERTGEERRERERERESKREILKPNAWEYN
jgi:hypothetical protein